MELAASGFDYFAGGLSQGWRVSEANGVPSPIEAARKDGYTIVTNRDQLMALRPGVGKVWSIWTKPDGNETLFYEMDRPADQPSLQEFTRKGIELLDNPKGFFMMVEGGLIDGACHAHDLASSVRDTLALDEAIAEALEFYEKHPAETLIVVTNDHETGGMGLNGSLIALHPRVSGQKGSQEAFGRQAKEFRDRQLPFEQALPVIKEYFGFADLSVADTKLLANAHAETLKEPNSRVRDEAYTTLYARLEPISVACTHLLARQSGVAFGTWGHTDMPAPVTAIGAGAEAFTGYYENTDLFHRIRAAMALSRK
jgi:alkaline phosphatase